MQSNVKNKHMSFSDRQVIEKGIFNNSSKVSIAETLGKDPSTIAKEIKEHRFMAYKCSMALQCAAYQKCRFGRCCKSDCAGYIPFKCKRRDKSPGACNGCQKYSSCRFNKYRYDAAKAQNEYKEGLSGTRQGFNITVDEVKRIGGIIKPLLKNGQSVDQILIAHKEITLSNKTIYTYIESGLFKSVGVDITVMDLRRQVSRKDIKSRRNLYKKRNDAAYLEGRRYKDFQQYIGVNPYCRIVEMDTVYNDVTEGPFIQTFKFIRYGFLFSVFHKDKTSEAMNSGVLLLEKILKEELFTQEVEVLLTDRGSEFYGLKNVEIREDGTVRTRVYYCDPMASHQKGSVENKHEELRYICPNGTDLIKLGLDSQKKMNLITSHINSAPRKKLDGKSPIELMKFFQPELWKRLHDFGIDEIEKDNVILKPFLLKDK